MRYLTSAGYSFVYMSFFALFSVTGLTRKWRHVKKSLRAQIEPAPEEGDLKWRWGKAFDATGRAYNLRNPLGVIAYMWVTVRSRYPTGKQLWDSLAATYGKERVISPFAAHPIPVPIETPWQVPLVAEYCRLWLNKYAPDMAVTTAATGYLVAATAFIPVLLLPGSLDAAFGATAEVHRWSWLWPILALLLLYLIITSPRSPRAAFQLFYRFVTVQLIEQSRVTSMDQAKSTSGNGTTKGSMLLVPPARRSRRQVLSARPLGCKLLARPCAGAVAALAAD